MEKTALIVGVTGITGQNLAGLLIERGWKVYGLARKPAVAGGVVGIAADLQDSATVLQALEGIDVTHVFLCTWLRQATEAENVRVNGAMIENVLGALSGAQHLQHVALVTGTKHYLGPFESYGQNTAETPFREDSPRLPGLNFYYTQEDIVLREAAERGFSWSVHRSHTMIGFALGNAMNMGVTLAVYATICRETGQKFVFPGSLFQWNALTDLTDTGILAEHLHWAATTDEAKNTPFNIVNGDVFRWRWLWPKLAEYFGVEAAGPGESAAPLEKTMKGMEPTWEKIAAKHGLHESSVDKLASWWHTDADLGREIECVNDMTNSRTLGFTAYCETLQSFVALFEKLKQQKIIPA